LPINHQLLHLVGLVFIFLSKMHGQSSIKFVTMTLWAIAEFVQRNRFVFDAHSYFNNSLKI